MKELQAPFTKEMILDLRIGDMALISGKLYTGRDAVHKRLHEGTQPPVSFTNQIIYHCGPVVLEKQDGTFEVKAAGPTTSIREEPYQSEIIRDHGILGIIGKGGMGAKTLKGLQDYGCVYFHAVGGAAQVLAEKIISVDGVYWKDLGPPEAIWELQVKDFPAVVTMDAHGRSIHAEIDQKSSQALKELL